MTALDVIETERLKLLPLDIENINPGEQQIIGQKLGIQLAGIILCKQIDKSLKASMRASLEKIIEDKLEQWSAEWHSVLIILKEGNELIGGFCFQQYSWNPVAAQLGYMIRTEYQKKGYMTEALKEGIPWIFRKGISCLQAETTKSNLPSQRVLEKAGMKIRRETQNSLIWELEMSNTDNSSAQRNK